LSLAEDFSDSPTIAWMKEWAGKIGAHLVGSVMVRQDGAFYNRLVWVDEKGGVQYYDKRHLFSLSAEPEHFTPGKEKLVVQLNDWRICPMICYDLRFPVWIRNRENYDLLVFIANWPERRIHHWECLLKARAIENQCYVVGANRVGFDGEGVYHDGRSAVIDPWGNTLVQAAHSAHVLEQTLDLGIVERARAQLPFLRDMDRFEME
jgi:predicted amidohydrolase